MVNYWETVFKWILKKNETNKFVLLYLDKNLDYLLFCDKMNSFIFILKITLLII